MHRSTRLRPLAVLLLFLASFAGSCDHTQLTGRILAPEGPIQMGVPVPLALEVPENLDGIHREYWRALPEGCGTILPTDHQGREVVFIPATPGDCRIEAWGFYKQTNPQPITERTFTVLEPD